MEYLVCLHDGTRLQATSADPDREGGPIVRCPACARFYVFNEEGVLESTTDPDSPGTGG